jgi:outer membrane protein assembly factor BamB
MKNMRFGLALALLLAGSAVVVRPAADARPGIDWPSFRGISANGIGDGYPTATSWDVATRTNIKWTTPVAGLGHSSPVIWGNRLCITTAISGGGDNSLKIGLYGNVTSVNDTSPHVWKLLCYDKNTGKSLLDKTVVTGVPKIKRHTKSTHASSTLATDGTRLVAMFGSEGLHAFDFSGKVLWTKDFGVLDSSWSMDPTAQWDFGSSPVIHDGVVIIQADVQKNSFLAAFDVATGKELWRTPRADVPTWSTPTIHTVNGRTQVLINGWKQTGAYDLKTGKPIWTLNGGGDIPVPTPITGRGLVFMTSAHGPMSPVYAIKDTAEGDISPAAGTPSPAMAWSVPRDGSYMATPILYRDLLYVARWNGVLGVYHPATGERAHQGRLGGGTSAFTASAVAADGKIYFTSEEGDVYVLKAGTFEVLATNSLGAVAMATPAISEGVLYFRTASGLIAIK